MGMASDGRSVLDLQRPGLELQGSGRKGERDRVVILGFRKEGPRKVEVKWRREGEELLRRDEKGGKEKL